MYEYAQEIFDYLPIRRNGPENDYINHLWDAFLALESAENSGRSFLVMPFHLLFMLALQYKVLRISSELEKNYQTAFIIHGSRDKNSLIKPGSVFDIALLQERTMPDLFKLIGVDDNSIKNIKILIDYRNENLAHAKGGIEQDSEKRIEEYIESLRSIQLFIEKLNDNIAYNWLLNVSEEDSVYDFIESKLLYSKLCPADFKTGKLKENFGSIFE